jgi:O-antigen ligase
VLSFVAGLLVFFFAIKRDFKVRNLLKLSMCILSIIVLLSIVVFSTVQDFENWFAADKERWVSVREESEESVKLRQFQDKWYWERFLEKPLMGHGLTLNEYFMDVSGEAAGMTHNQYIKILATSGLVGAMIHVVFLLSIFILIKNRVTGRWRPLFFSQFFSLLIQAIFAPIDINLFTFLGFVLAVTKVELLEARNATYKYHYKLQKLYKLSPV